LTGTLSIEDYSRPFCAHPAPHTARHDARDLAHFSCLFCLVGWAD